LLYDADLDILAAPDERYRAYAGAVRWEYGHLSDEEFRSGRTAVLRELAGRPRLYATPEGMRRWDGAARQNLQQELNRLDAAASDRQAALSRDTSSRARAGSAPSTTARSRARTGCRSGRPERAPRHLEPGRELVPLVVRHVADQVRPALPALGPDRRIHQHRHPSTVGGVASALSGTATTWVSPSYQSSQSPDQSRRPSTTSTSRPCGPQQVAGHARQRPEAPTKSSPPTVLQGRGEPRQRPLRIAPPEQCRRRLPTD